MSESSAENAMLRGLRAQRKVCVLVPYDRREALSRKEAAALIGKSINTTSRYAREHGVGRRVFGGQWQFSKVALAMLKNDDAIALRAYLDGDRRSDLVGAYFRQEGLAALWADWESSALRG